MESASVPKKHAKYSPSAAHRWMECPASIGLSEQAPDQPESRYAREGTDAHFCLEQLLRNLKAPLQTESDLTKKFGKQMVSDAAQAAKFLLEKMPKGSELLVETKVDLSFISKDMSGTVDVAFVELFNVLHIVDFKYGAGIAVEPDENPQLIAYALGIAHQYHYNFEIVKIGIYQPRAEHPGGPYREWTTTPYVLEQWAVKFKDAIDRTILPNPEFVSGEHCRFCPAAVVCPEISTVAIKKARIAFDAPSGALALPDVKSSVAIEHLPQILNAAVKIEKWIDQVRTHAYQLAESGIPINGWKLVAKRSTRKWTEIVKTEKAAVKLFGPEALTEPELKSPAQLEKLIDKKDLKAEKKRAFIDDRVSNVSSGTTLVSDDDPRESVHHADQFTDLTA